MNKVCSKCGELKPLEAFNRDRRRRDERKARCKTCLVPQRKAARKSYYWTNRDDAIRKAAEWSYANIEKKRKSGREYAKRNPDKQAENRRNWRSEGNTKYHRARAKSIIAKSVGCRIRDVPLELADAKGRQLLVRRELKRLAAANGDAPK